MHRHLESIFRQTMTFAPRSCQGANLLCLMLLLVVVNRAAADLPLWLTEVAAAGRFNDDRCNEKRTMRDLVVEMRADPDLFVSGGLGRKGNHAFGTWTCIADHPCLEAVGASPDDRMCYAVHTMSKKLHTWGLNSELALAVGECAARTNRTRCHPGYSSGIAGGPCKLCSSSTYKDVEGTELCTSCPAHSISQAGSTSATDCKCNTTGGYFGPDGGPCHPCQDSGWPGADNATVKGIVQGIDASAPVVISLGSAFSDKYLKTVNLTKGTSASTFEFANVPSGAEYWIKFEGFGYATSPSQMLCLYPGAALNVSWTASSPTSSSLSGGATFSYKWELDASRAGWVTEAASAVEAPVIAYLNESFTMIGEHAAVKLLYKYGILLQGKGWGSEYAFRLLDTISTIPNNGEQSYYDRFDIAEAPLRSVWILETGAAIDNDIDVGSSDATQVRRVRIHADAFTNASPLFVTMDRIAGKYFSNRLYQAVVRFLTDNGADYYAIENIFWTRFGAKTLVSDSTIRSVTASSTQESSAHFQPWSRHPEEALATLSMFEEQPPGFHKVQGLDYLLRRQDGNAHPLYPSASAVAWPRGHQVQSYMEFMQSGFMSGIRHLRRLVLHEKAHFLWENVFGESIKADWTALGGWHQNTSDPHDWSTTKQLELMTAYDHGNSPGEHMAEAISYFIENPSSLRACCQEQYDFVRDRVMHGHRYFSTLAEDNSFGPEVLNLSPDYKYPGRITKVDIQVSGAPDQDKTVTVSISLFTSGDVFEGAEHAFFRLFSSIGTTEDIYLYPTTVAGNELTNTFTLSKHAKAGHWFPRQIMIQDSFGDHQAGMSDFGWKLLIDSPLEDLDPPRYIPGSLNVTTRAATRESRSVQIAYVSWLLSDDKGMNQWGGIFAELTCDPELSPSCASYSMRLQEYGYPGLVPAGPSDNCGNVAAGHTCYRATIEFILTDFRPSGAYWITFLSMNDVAFNHVSQEFSDDPGGQPRVIFNMSFTDTDDTPPVLDIASMRISARPTNPDAPNGETILQIKFNATDDKSGLGSVNYRLFDPLGGSHFEYHYHRNFYTLFFDGDATASEEYTINMVLPVGSDPGMWGLESIEMYDKADNRVLYTFSGLESFQMVKDGARRAEHGAARRKLRKQQMATRLEFRVQ